MQIIVEGSRSSTRNWSLAQMMPLEELPMLSPEQKRLAGRQGIPEEVFARNAKAKELSLPDLAAKAETVGRLIEVFAQEKRPDARVEEVSLVTFHGRFDVRLKVDSGVVRLAVDENVIDELLQKGSEDSEKQLRRILELNLTANAL